MKHLIVYLFLLCLASSLCAQQRTLTGKVTDAAKQVSLQGVSVTVCRADGKSILAFAITDEDGTFSLNVDSTKASRAVIRFSCLGYAAVTRPIQPQDQTYRIGLQPEEISIREVIVKGRFRTKARPSTNSTSRAKTCWAESMASPPTVSPTKT